MADVRRPGGCSWWSGCPRCSTLGAAVKGTLGDPFPFAPWYAVLPALLPALLIGPIEELGWRGIALPLLQRRLAPLWASLILGVVVAVWHTPAFFLSGTKQSAWAIGPFFLGVVAISVILAAMFNASRGSLLVAVLFHAQMNGPAWPDAQPWDMYLFVVVAVVVVLVNRKAMLSRAAGATAVLIDGDGPADRHRPMRRNGPTAATSGRHRVASERRWNPERRQEPAVSILSPPRPRTSPRRRHPARPRRDRRGGHRRRR